MVAPGDVVLVRYDLPGPPLWHERLILAVGNQPGHFAVLTPDGDIFVEELRPDNLDIAEFRSAPGLGVQPPDIPIASVYRFRVVPTAAEMLQHVADGAAAAAAAAPGPAGAAAQAGPPLAWVAAEDTQDITKGTQIPTLPDNAVTLGDKAIIQYGNGHLFVQRMAEADIYRFVHDDLRVLPVVTDASGERKVGFADAVAAMDPTPPRGGLGLDGPPTTFWQLKQIRDDDASPNAHHERWEIFQASAVVMSYSLDFIKLALHRCLGLFMLIDMVRRSQAIGHAIFFLCLQLMQDMRCLSKFWLQIEPSGVVSGVRKKRRRLEDVLDQEGRQVLIEGADRMLKTPQEWGKVIETSPHVTPYFDEVLRADQIAYEGFVKDLYHAGIVEFSFEVEDHITPFFVDKKGVALRMFMHEHWSRKRRLWHSAALECKWISALLPLAWSDPRMPWIPQDLEAVKPIVDRFEPSPYEFNFLFKGIPEGLLQDSMWKTSDAAPFVFKEGIGDLESRATVSGVRHTLRRELVGSIGIKASNLSESHVETFLEANAVAERTHAMYAKRVADFESWADARGPGLTSAKLVDCALVDYLNQMWDEGADIGEATGTCAAWVKLRPSFSKRGPDKLVRTVKALQGFNRLDPGMTRPPLPLAFAALIAVELVGMNLVSMALAVMLMFSAYLRPIELLSLQVTDVLVPTKGIPCYAIHLHRAERGQPSKVGLYDETLLLDSSALPFLGYLLDARRGAAAGPALFDFDYRSFNESFKTAAGAAGLAALKPDLYQLRHGGPSHDILNRLRSKAEVKDRGPEKAMVGDQDLFGAIVNTSGVSRGGPFFVAFQFVGYFDKFRGAEVMGRTTQLVATKAADLAIIWGLGSRQCPPCPDCVVTCPTVTCSTPSINITCPTFSCPSVTPQVAEGAGWSGIFGFVAGLLVGFGLLTCTGLIGRCGGWLTSFVFRRPEPEAVVDDTATRDLALKQLAIIRGAAVPGAAAAAAAAPGPAGAAAQAGPPLAWVAAEDTQDITKGTQIPTLPDNAVTLGDKAIIQYGNGHLFVQRMAEADIYRFVHDDLRVLPVVTDASGERKVGFADAVAAMDPTPPRGGLGLDGPPTTFWQLKQIREIFQASAVVMSYSLDFIKLALHRCLGLFMLIDMVRRSQAIGHAIFFLCLQLMQDMRCLSKFWLQIEPSGVVGGVRMKLEDVLDQEGRQVEDHITPFFVDKKGVALRMFMHEHWSRKRRLWHSAALECKWISALLPLAWSDPRMPWIPQDLEAVKPIVDRFEPSPYEFNFLFKGIPEGLLQDSMWKTSDAAPFVFKEGIGDLESRATVSGVRHTLRRELVGSIGIKASNLSESHVETFLEANAVAERTHAMYAKRVADFESWADARGPGLTSAKLVDCALVDYLNQMWDEGADIGEATGTCAAWVKLRPSFSKRGPDKLVRTVKALQGFNRLDPGMTRPPLPLAFAALIAVELVGMNLVSMALAVMLMFSAYLRPIELLSLQVTDVLVPTKGIPCYAIHLHRAERGQPSKVGLYDETLLLDSSALPFLGYLLDARRGAAAGPALFDFDYRSFNESFKTAAGAAGLAALKPDLYQLRHGGPSHDILNRLRSKAEVKDR
ncbi:unnamed protein product, partial [Prorocentrum cordatum]